MNRGVAREAIVVHDRDRVDFGAVLAMACGRHPVEVHAYCLMGNHFHLLVRDPHRELSPFMKLIGVTFTRHFNDRVGRDGPIFRGRFHSIPVETDAHVVEGLRYIHRNPIDIVGIERLDDYPWSSHQAYLGRRFAPKWLVTGTIGARFADRADYRAFVHADSGGFAPEPVSVAHLVALLVVELDLTYGSFPGLLRDVMVVLGDRHAEQRLDVGSAAATSPGAQRTARSRARSRFRDDATFAQLIRCLEQALHLGSDPRCNGQVVRSSPARSWAA